MIKFYHEMKTPYLAPLKNTHLTIHWLGGFTDLLLSLPLALMLRFFYIYNNNKNTNKSKREMLVFYIFNYKPRLNFENHIKELELFNRIKDFLNLNLNFYINNNLSITKLSLDRSNSNATISLYITDIHIKKKSIVPLYSKDGILKTKNLKILMIGLLW
jgi:hypothetical protein